MSVFDLRALLLSVFANTKGHVTVHATNYK